MKFLLLSLLFAAVLLPAAEPNLIVNPGTGKLWGGTPAAGVTAELRDGEGYVAIDGANKQYHIPIPLTPGVTSLKVTLKLRATGVVPGKEGWQNGRLAMRFYGKDGKGVGPWPDVFSAKGDTDWINCERVYAVPGGAVRLMLEPANFGTAGKAEFSNLRVEAIGAAKPAATGANLIVNPATGKLRAGNPAAGITAELREGQGFIAIDGANRQLNIAIPIEAGVKLLRIKTRMRLTGVVPGKESWQDGRLAMRFYGKDGKGVGPWPDVFHGSGSGDWIECERLYPVPEGATSLTLGPANFGTAGKVEFENLVVEGVNNAAALDRDAPPPGGLAVGAIDTLEDAWRCTTPSRERISLNGLWHFRPVLPGEEVTAQPPPAGSGWGYFKVPGAWPVKENGMRFFLSPLTSAALDMEKLNSAWYRREIEVPAGWAGRKIVLSSDMLQSCAKIFVDGKPAAELYYPGGDADLTGKLIPGKKQTLELLVSANPVESSNFMAPERLIKLASSLSNRGITGDLYLDSRPVAASVSDVHVITSFRKKTIEFDTGFAALPAGTYRLAAEISDAADGKVVKEFESKPFLADGKPGFRCDFSGEWSNPRLWDTDTPENLYIAKLRLLDAKGALLDEFLPQEFGFREFYVDGRDFYLNGKKIHLRALVTKTPQESDFGSAGHVEHLVKAARDFGANFLIGWNYSFTPGVFSYVDSFHRGTSKRGMLTSLTLPHFKDFDGLEKPEQAAAYRRQAEHLIRLYQNVPGVIMNVMNHNATGYMGDQNPQRLGTAYRPEQALPPGTLTRRVQAELAEKIARSIDPSRPIYHHESGNLGDVFTLNCYLNWAPRQERGDWLENWSKDGAMPVFFVEWGLPHVASWSSFRGPAFIWRNAGLQCLWVNEFDAAILGEDAYRDEPAKEKLYAHQEKLIKGNRETFFSALGGNSILNKVEDVNRVRAFYAARTFRNLRSWGISGILPWDQFLCWDWVSNGAGSHDNPDRFKNLKRPGIVPDSILARGESINNPVAKFELSTTGKAVHAGFTPFLGWIGGKPGETTESGHNYAPGETVHKTLVMLNDTRNDAEIAWRWRIPALKLEQSGKVTVPPAGKFEQPVEFKVPADAPKEFAMEAEFDFPGQGGLTDRFSFDAIAPQQAKLASKVGLYDPEGKSADVLKRLGVNYKPVRSDADLDGISLLVLGRNALKGFPLHLSKRLSEGLKLFVFEQPFEEFERLGLRGTEQGYREVFSAAADFPDLHDWRGSATQLPGAFQVAPYEATNPKWNWCGFDNTRVWRAGNRGSITEVLLEKPPVGNWNPLLQCGFDLQYTPLAEFVEGSGRITFCQLAATGRTEAEPEADELVRRSLERLDRATVPQYRKVFYAGAEEGAKLLDSLKIPHQAYAGTLPPDALLVLGPGAKAGDLKNAVDAGANVLALGLGKADLDAILPGAFQLTPGEYASDFVDDLKKSPEFAGIGNAELHWRGKAAFDAFDAKSPGGRTLGVARIGKGVVVADQLPPWKFDAKEYYNRTTLRRAAFRVSRLLANLGAGAESGFYALFDGAPGNLKYSLPNDRWIGVADPKNEGREKGWMKPEFKPGSDWRKVLVPGNFDTQFKDLANYDGLFWYRLEFDLPKEFAGEECELLLGAIDDESWVWLNGRFLGEVTKETNPKDYWQFPRIHRLKAGDLKPGRNVLVVLCNDTFNYGGILGTPRLKVPVKHGFYTDTPIASDDPYRYYRW